MIYPNILSQVIKTFPAVKPHLHRATWKAVGGYEGIRGTYWAVVYDAVYDYLTGDRPVTSFRNAHLESMATAFMDATYLGYEETSGDPSLDEDTQAWLDGRIASERGFIVDMFARLKEASGIDPLAEAFSRADGFSKTLDAVYSEARLRGGKNVTVTWHLGETEQHCDTCASLNGKRHKISWLVERDYIPRKPGAAMDCGGWHCDCTITDKDGNEMVI